ncbi:MAG: hypothetical protein LBR81_10185 [Prevotellaceae bacterium]|jgi:hypothetical protein|nr:hypothetical protein [Prevotellaceae bacterium]
MKTPALFKAILIATATIFITSCDFEDGYDHPGTAPSKNSDFGYLKGTWVNKDNYALWFFDFYSETEARFFTSHTSEEIYDLFSYRTFDDKIEIKFQKNEYQTTHKLTKIDDETMSMSHFTVIPENPDLTFLKREIITGEGTGLIELKRKQIYYDHDFRFSLEIESVTDSRCPEGAQCVSAGDVEVHFDLILNGNSRHKFVLHQNEEYLADNGLVFSLVDVEPYPTAGKSFVRINQNDYKATIMLTLSPPNNEIPKELSGKYKGNIYYEGNLASVLIPDVEFIVNQVSQTEAQIIMDEETWKFNCPVTVVEDNSGYHCVGSTPVDWNPTPLNISLNCIYQDATITIRSAQTGMKTKPMNYIFKGRKLP